MVDLQGEPNQRVLIGYLVILVREVSPRDDEAAGKKQISRAETFADTWNRLQVYG